MSASGQADILPAFFPTRRPAAHRFGGRGLTMLRRVFLLLQALASLVAGAVAALSSPFPLGSVPLGWIVVASTVAGLMLAESSRLFERAGAKWVGVAGSVAVATAGAAATLELLGADRPASLAWCVCYVGSAGLLLVGLRTAYATYSRGMLASGRLATRVAVVGGGPVASRTLARLQESDPRLVALIGHYADRSAETVAAFRIRGDIRTLLCDCRLQMVDAVVLALEPDDEEELLRLRYALRPCIQDIYVSAELMGHAGPAARAASLGSTPLLLVNQRPICGLQGVGKIMLDQFAAWLLLLFMAPVLGMIALAIRLESPGPILFRQLRVGYNNQLFHILKFRSMYHEATDRLAKQQTILGDRRVTRVGRLIRRLSLDELPQLLNVVRGEMSLVGPRPHAPGTSIGSQRVHHLVEDYLLRHLVRPGITGLAQVRGLRGGLHQRTQVAERLAADLEYLRTWSLWLDLKIILLTVFLEFRGYRGF